MLDVEVLPPARQFPPARRAAERARLEQAVVRSRTARSWRRRALLLSVASATLLGGGAAAAHVLRPAAPATDKSKVRCYTVLDVGRGKHFLGTEMGFAPSSPTGSDQLPPAAEAVDLCASLWSQGFLTAGANAHDPDESVRHQVPPLTACILPSGVAAVFPAEKGECQRLDLAELAE